jgi:hypothetical protein
MTPHRASFHRSPAAAQAPEPEPKAAGDSSADTTDTGESGAGEGSVTEPSLSPAMAASDASAPDLQ